MWGGAHKIILLWDLLVTLSFAGIITKLIAVYGVLGFDMIIYVSKCAFIIEGMAVFFSDELRGYLKQ